MVREGYLKNGPKSREGRGSEKFVRVSWDKALDLVASEMKRVYGEYGPSAVFGRSYGWMSTGKVNASINLQQRLLNFCGGFIGCENSYSTAAISKILPYVVGSGDPRSTSWDVVIEHADRVVFWGADPIVTNDIDWLTTLHNGTGYVRALKAKGTKTYSINPVATDTGEYLGSEWIAPRPGTDCAMMLGMIQELVKSGKADMAFLEKYTSGHKEFLDYVMGRTDGVEKTPEWAEGKTGVKADVIRKLAHDFREHRTMIMMGWGIQRTQYGEQPHWMGFALAAALGQIGLPGGGIGTNYQYSSGGSPTAYGPFLGGISGAVKPLKPSTLPWKGSQVIPVARFVECFLNPGKTIDFNGRKVTYPEVKLVMWAGGNPFTHQPDTNKLARAWKKPDTVIVTDTVWTATARHADIVLPAATVFEHNDITNIGTYSNDGLVAMQQAIKPQWESKPDYWIFSELAKRMGCGKEFTFTRGIEAGHVFKLGTKYSASMGANFLGEDQTSKPMIMGCYGIGISRVVAAAIEQSHDDNGIIWPAPLAPFDVALVAIDYASNPEVKKHADEIAAQLEAAGFSVLLDDRDERAGIKFKDMDLIGLPHRLVVSSRTVKDGQCEYKKRTDKEAVRWNLDEAVKKLLEAAGK